MKCGRRSACAITCGGGGLPLAVSTRPSTTALSAVAHMATTWSLQAAALSRSSLACRGRGVKGRWEPRGEDDVVPGGVGQVRGEKQDGAADGGQDMGRSRLAVQEHKGSSPASFSGESGPSSAPEQSTLHAVPRPVSPNPPTRHGAHLKHLAHVVVPQAGAHVLRAVLQRAVVDVLREGVQRLGVLGLEGVQLAVQARQLALHDAGGQPRLLHGQPGRQRQEVLALLGAAQAQVGLGGGGCRGGAGAVRRGVGSQGVGSWRSWFDGGWLLG